MEIEQQLLKRKDLTDPQITLASERAAELVKHMKVSGKKAMALKAWTRIPERPEAAIRT